MAHDGDVDEESEDDASGSDREDIRTIIREELGSVLAEFRNADKSTNPPPGEDIDVDEPVAVTVRDIEAAAEKAVREAMTELANKAPVKKAPAKKAPAKVEEPPENPPTNWLDKVKKAAWS